MPEAFEKAAVTFGRLVLLPGTQSSFPPCLVGLQQTGRIVQHSGVQQQASLKHNVGTHLVLLAVH